MSSPGPSPLAVLRTLPGVLLVGSAMLAGGAAGGVLLRPLVVDPVAARQQHLPEPPVVDAGARAQVRGDVRDAMNAILAVGQRLEDDTLRRIGLRGIDTADVLDPVSLDALAIAGADANDLRLAAWDLANAIAAIEGVPADPAFVRAGVDGRALAPGCSMLAARFAAEARLFAAATRGVALQTRVGDTEDRRVTGGNAALATLLPDLAVAAADAVDARFAASRALFADEAAGLTLDRLDELQTLLATMESLPAGNDDVLAVADALEAIRRTQDELGDDLEALTELVRERLPEPAPPAGAGEDGRTPPPAAAGGAGPRTGG